MNDSKIFDRPDGVAVIGMAGRFPGSRNINEFWRNLQDGVESISFFSDEELENSGISKELLNNSNYVRAKGVLEDYDLFDASFFDIGAREAEFMDPQHRLLLECAWEAIESAGYDPKTCKGRVGVFAGQTRNNYLVENLLSNTDLVQAVGAHQALLGCEPDYLATRISYKLGLEGPAVTIQTACSTSLVAVHLACQSLLNGECSIALAGGVSVTFPQKSGYLYREGGILSPDGHCRAFDARAKGCVEGSGVGVVVLKTVEDALRDGDFIWAVILGSSVNNDGSVKAGFTAPSIEGQAKVIAEAITMAGVDVSTISYVETHGTGTNLGDPIEIAALTRAFRALGCTQRSCAISSVKTNIGHLDVAAGVTGLIKTVLSIKNRMLPPSLHFERANPEIDFDRSPFYVNAELIRWQTDGAPLRAGVSSFGVGGANAHVVLEEAPAASPADQSDTPQLLVISAKSSSALDIATAALVEHLKQNDDVNLPDVAYTLQVGRRAFDYRRIAVCNSIDDAIDALSRRDSHRVITSSTGLKARSFAFMFPGQGTQYVNMALEIYQREPLFRRQVDLCSEILAAYLDQDIREILYPAQNQVEEAKQRLNQTCFTQPALFVIEYALATLLTALGIQPQAMIGHSIGEYVAACLAGVFSLEDALKLVALRGRLMQSLPAGSMLTVALPEQALTPFLDREISLAAVNGHSHCVVSGPAAAIQKLQERFKHLGVDSHQLSTSHAFHSHLMDPILEPLVEEFKKIKLNPPKIAFVSNVTGTYITTAEATDAAYWATHLRRTVFFDRGLRELLKDSNRDLLEVGPGKGLSSLAKHHPNKSEQQIVRPCLRHENEKQSDLPVLLTVLGELWLAGAQLNWRELHGGARRVRIPLPTYPFERRRYWVTPRPRTHQANNLIASAGRKPDPADWFYVPLWKQSIPPTSGPQDKHLKWLLFLDECGVGEKLVRVLRQKLQDVTIVRPGERFYRPDKEHYIIDPRRPEDYVNLLASFSEPPRVIAHLWSVRANGPAGENPQRPQNIQDFGFYSLLYLAQAIGQHVSTAPIRIVAISNNTHQVALEDIWCPEKATLLGLCRVIPQEYPNITCGSIDITIPDSGSREERKLLERLEAELVSASPERMVAYRGAQRWVRSFEPIRFQSGDRQSLRLRDGGVYLITGGLGGVGFELARLIAQTVKAKIALTGRSAFPDRDEWGQWLATRGKRDQTSQKIEKVRSLEQIGADVMVFSADVADPGQMQAVVRQTSEKFGRINGVIHAAGIADGGAIQVKRQEAAAGVLAPKVDGTLVLDALFEDTPLDFFVLCSSLTSILGGFGQAAYCAANAFLDAFAHYRSARTDSFTVSINWDAWREVGMAAKSISSKTLTGDQPMASEPASHPLLDLYLTDTDGREIYLTDFSPDRHWVLNEHRILGRPVVPGTAYLEMARAAIEKHAGGRAIEIRDVFFLTPLSVQDGVKKRVHTVLERDGDSFRFSMKSRTDSNQQSAPEWQQHAMGTITSLGPEPTVKHSVKELLQRCDLQEVTFPEGRLAEDDGPRWRSIGSARLGTNEALIAIKIPPAFVADLEHFWLHPSLLDVATGAAKRFFGDGSAYLPFSYKRLRVSAPLKPNMFSYARLNAGTGSSKETLTFDISIIDEDGIELVAIDEFTSKRVNDAALRIRAWEEDGARAPVVTGLPSEMPEETDAVTGKSLEDALLTKEAVAVFSRILSGVSIPQVAISTKDLQAVIEEVDSLSKSLAEPKGENFRKAASVHPRPNLTTDYTAPTTETEEKLAEIWRELLGVERVGIHDNFFELGGDSVLAIQIIVRAKQLDLQIAPQHLFQHQTIAELAAIIEPSRSMRPEQESIVGIAPLSPAQHRFFQENFQEPNQHGAALLLALRPGIDASLLEVALQHLLDHHDALRLKFHQTDQGWRMENASPGAAVTIQRVDGSPAPPQELNASAQSIAARLCSSIELSKEPLIRAALFESPSHEQAHLLLMIHPLLADRKSWRILLEDLRTAFEQLSQEKEVKLPAKTASFKRWSELMNEYTQSEGFMQESAFWPEVSWAIPPSLPIDFSVNAGDVESADTVSVSLTIEETETLARNIATSNHAQVSELLLAALVSAVSNWSRRRSLLIDIEDDYRNGPLKALDLSRTVGQFTFTYPVLFEIDHSSTPAHVLKLVKERSRHAARRGAYYDLLRYVTKNSEIADPLRKLPRAQVKFDYTEEFYAKGDGLYSIGAVLENGTQRSCPYLLKVTGCIKDGRLLIFWTYRKDVHRRSTIEGLVRSHCEALRWFITNAQSSELAAALTASDFPLANLDLNKLNKISHLLDKADSV